MLNDLINSHVRFDLSEQISEPDLFGIDLNFQTVCNSGYLHYTQGKLLQRPNINIRDSNLILKNPFSGLWLILKNPYWTLQRSDILYSRGSFKLF